MFTGIVQAVGTLIAREPQDGDVRLRIGTGGLDLAGVGEGDSVCVSGVCLTAVRLAAAEFEADVSAETLRCTTLGGLAPGARLNLERAVTPQTLLGGHLVNGHVDGTGRLRERVEEARSVRLGFEAPAELARYIAVKGCICVDGVSLTVNRVRGAGFEVNVVPHTLRATTLADLAPGDRVNLEVDLVARYLERLLESRG